MCARAHKSEYLTSLYKEYPVSHAVAPRSVVSRKGFWSQWGWLIGVVCTMPVFLMVGIVGGRYLRDRNVQSPPDVAARPVVASVPAPLPVKEVAPGVSPPSLEEPLPPVETAAKPSSVPAVLTASAPNRQPNLEALEAQEKAALDRYLTVKGTVPVVKVNENHGYFLERTSEIKKLIEDGNPPVIELKWQVADLKKWDGDLVVLRIWRHTTGGTHDGILQLFCRFRGKEAEVAAGCQSGDTVTVRGVLHRLPRNVVARSGSYGDVNMTTATLIGCEIWK